MHCSEAARADVSRTLIRIFDSQFLGAAILLISWQLPLRPLIAENVLTKKIADPSRRDTRPCALLINGEGAITVSYREMFTKMEPIIVCALLTIIHNRRYTRKRTPVSCYSDERLVALICNIKLLCINTSDINFDREVTFFK